MRLHDHEAPGMGRYDGFAGKSPETLPVECSTPDNLLPLEETIAWLRNRRESLRRLNLASGVSLRAFDALLAVLEADHEGLCDANR